MMYMKKTSMTPGSRSTMANQPTPPKKKKPKKKKKMVRKKKKLLKKQLHQNLKLIKF